MDTIIVDLSIKTAKNNFCNYVALTRVKTLQDLHILRDF